MLVYTCSNCGIIRLVSTPPIDGFACPVCTGVGTQQRLSVTVNNTHDVNEGTDVEVQFNIIE